MNTFLSGTHSCQVFSVAFKRAVSKPVPSTAKRRPRISATRCRPMSTTAGKVMDLPDGRHLGYHVFGDPTGTPILYIHGTPDSGITLSGFEDRLTKRLGIRWIAPDRSGIGNSTFYPHRRVSDYPADLRALIQHLGLSNYHIIGTSGGTGYTLTCAQALPREELLAVGICAGVGPWESGQAGQSELVQKLIMVWKDQNEEFVKYMEGIFLAAAQDPDPTKMEAVWRDGEKRSRVSKPRTGKFCRNQTLFSPLFGFSDQSIPKEGLVMASR